MADYSTARVETKRDFAEFLESDYGHATGEGKYIRQIDDIIKNYPSTQSARLIVDLQDVADASEDLHRRLLASPGDCLPAFEDALRDLVASRDPKFSEQTSRVHVGFSGEFGEARVSPRALSSQLLNQLVCVEGIVTKSTLVHPKLVKSVHWCEETGVLSQREYRDGTSWDGPATAQVYPTRDAGGNLLSTQFGLCQFVDHQTLTIQELPERAPPGQLPRSVDVVLEDDLRDAAKPGDRVRISGVYRALAPGAGGGVARAVFRAVLMAGRVSFLTGQTRGQGGKGAERSSGEDGTADEEAAAPLPATLREADYDNIQSLASEPDVLHRLSQALAPSIHGHTAVKKALLLLLAGGRERRLNNGTRLRGDLNCLLVGDPGVAKSQLLRAVMQVAPLCVSTTGRGSSGVGLTAAVTSDADTGERRLEAGAMVLADRGVVCIDEFDKMSDADRVAIHEVMEQQTVTVAKAGILAQLNARCSVVAAANPVYGHYDRGMSVTRNIGLPDSLLSRFDLLFVLLDTSDARRDRVLAEHVLGQHRWRPAGDDGRGGEGQDEDDEEEEGEGDDRGREDACTPMHAKYDARLYGARVAGRAAPLSLAFLKLYVAFAKARFAAPRLTHEACAAVAEYYADLRAGAAQRALPVTVRTLETVVRCSCAHAKLRLSALVEVADVEAAMDILDLVLGSAQEGALEEGGALAGIKRKRAAPKEGHEEEAVEPLGGGGGASPGSDDASPGDDASLAERVAAAVARLGRGAPDACNLAGVLALVREGGVGAAAGPEDVRRELSRLEEMGKLMLEGDDFYLTH